MYKMKGLLIGLAVTAGMVGAGVELHDLLDHTDEPLPKPPPNPGPGGDAHAVRSYLDRYTSASGATLDRLTATVAWTSLSAKTVAQSYRDALAGVHGDRDAAAEVAVVSLRYGESPQAVAD